MNICFMTVTLDNKSRNRILRKIVKWKNPLHYCMTFIVVLGLLYGAYSVCRLCYYGIKYCYHAYILDDLYSSYNSSTKIGPTFKFYESGPYGYIENTHTRKRILNEVTWVSGVNEEDSLLCFASHGKRGYFNRHTGEIPIPATYYINAWIFSEGLAAVMEADSTLKFINPKGEVIIDKQFKYSDLLDDMAFVFHNGYCPMGDKNGVFGLIDKNGNWVLEPEYDGIIHTDKDWWIVSKGNKFGVLNDSLKIILPPEFKSIDVEKYGLEVLNMNYERKLFDLEGKLLQDFMFTDIRDLSYKIPKVGGHKTDSEDEYEWYISEYKEYRTTYSFDDDNRVGLLSPDGKPITPPLYAYIVALGPDRFRCYYNLVGSDSVEEGLSILINSKGKVINQL